ncbi:signal peptidase I [Pontiellaceae bacterium B1224]|nr:signal peptidase I [Pontiellaceae bacterium B1224]
MDIKKPRKTEHAKWVGLLCAFLWPGSAHFLAGQRKIGILLFVGQLAIPMVGICVAAIPHLASLYLGLILIFVVSPIYYLTVLVKSYRHIHRLSLPGWVGFAALLVAMNLLKAPMIGSLPVKTYSLPTGGMAPTLQGRRAIPGEDSTRWGDSLFQGKTYYHISALASGAFQNPRYQDKTVQFQIGGVPYQLPIEIFPAFKPKTHYEQSELIWSGILQSGDRMLADRFSYLFSEPQRGDVVVFETKDLDYQGINPNTVFVKRIAGLPGETIQIINARLWVDGKEISEPQIFQLLNYGNAGKLASSEESITLGPDEYLVLGDNTAPNMSLDGRFFGPVRRDRIIGKIQTIYWPFQRMGIVE